MSPVAIITGCSSGIGFMTALEFARNGYVTYASMRDLSRKTELETGAKTENLSLKIIQLNVNVQKDIDVAIEMIEKEQGKLDVLVNNAGYGLFGSFDDTSIEEMKEQFETDYFGAIRMIKKSLHLLRKSNSARIINVSSVAGLIGFPFSSSYVASKFALEGISECLRYELKKFGIQVALIEPGVVNTKFYENKKIAKGTYNDSNYKNEMESFTKMGDSMFQRNATAPNVVAKKILEISRLNIMEPRYLVGQEADQILKQKKIMTPLAYEKFIEDYYLKSLFQK